MFLFNKVAGDKKFYTFLIHHCHCDEVVSQSHVVVALDLRHEQPGAGDVLLDWGGRHQLLSLIIDLGNLAKHSLHVNLAHSGFKFIH